MRYKGTFDSQEEVVKKFPYGGDKGDWIYLKTNNPTVNGIGDCYEMYDWNTNTNRWEFKESHSYESQPIVRENNGTSLIGGMFVVIIVLSIVFGLPTLAKALFERDQTEKKELTNEEMIEVFEYVDEKIERERMDRKFGE